MILHPRNEHGSVGDAVENVCFSSSWQKNILPFRWFRCMMELYDQCMPFNLSLSVNLETRKC